MKLKTAYFFIFTLLVLIIFVSCNKNIKSNYTAETAKVALRAVGHDLLLQHNDSVSLVLPIVKLEENKYELSFQEQLEINPDSLLKGIFKNFKNTNLPNNYIVEVKNCLTNEVSYSYQIKAEKEKNIIPCRGRNLPLDCYTIQVIFEIRVKKSPLYWLLPIVLIGILLFIKRKNGSKKTNFISIGKYHFYEDQNRLKISDITINLTKKECEIITILSKNKNQVVKRELLVKEIWEDNGVIVGRSLDAYISKLRKKFGHDDSIKISNIHGVGYKLEVLG